MRFLTRIYGILSILFLVSSIGTLSGWGLTLWIPKLMWSAMGGAKKLGLGPPLRRDTANMEPMWKKVRFSNSTTLCTGTFHVSSPIKRDPDAMADIRRCKNSRIRPPVSILCSWTNRTRRYLEKSIPHLNWCNASKKYVVRIQQSEFCFLPCHLEDNQNYVSEVGKRRLYHPLPDCRRI